ncbi:MAG: hypothetical protein HYZ61_05505, partial [Candidatus Andersenbacteria bacterium]|nr:hypothetical protein [Candidatus Andersenbacteria bacterium]
MAYLHAVVNYLFSRYRDVDGTIVMNGGATDIFKPYKRTEAEEIKKWIFFTIGKSVHFSKVKKHWKFVVRPKSLTTVENLLNFAETIDLSTPPTSRRSRSGNNTLIFCEATRSARIHRLVREIPRLKKAKIIAIDFDSSTRRYDLDTIKKNERDFLRLELAALQDPTRLMSLRNFAKEKLRIMRTFSPEEAHKRLPEILDNLFHKI